MLTPLPCDCYCLLDVVVVAEEGVEGAEEGEVAVPVMVAMAEEGNVEESCCLGLLQMVMVEEGVVVPLLKGVMVMEVCGGNFVANGYVDFDVGNDVLLKKSCRLSFFVVH